LGFPLREKEFLSQTKSIGKHGWKYNREIFIHLQRSLQGLLTLDPSERPSAQEVFEHLSAHHKLEVGVSGEPVNSVCPTLLRLEEDWGFKIRCEVSVFGRS